MYVCCKVCSLLVCTLCIQVSHLESELKNEKEKMSRLLRDKSVDPETAHSLQLSNDLQIVRARLDFEVSAKAALEHEMTSLKESLVVNGKGNFGKNATLITELRVEVAREKEKICQLEQSLAEKEAEVKRQTQIQARTISDLQSKLSRERQQREELRQSVPTPGAGPRTSGASSPDTARVLQEKEKTIEELVYKLQKLEKTASEVVKIAQHSKTQSETIVTLKGDLRHAQVYIVNSQYYAYAWLILFICMLCAVQYIAHVHHSFKATSPILYRQHHG